MVILETAAITAAGYGLYRGGDAAVRKGKETHKELQRERVRQSQRGELNQKVKTRQERISQLVQLKEQKAAATTSTLSTTTTTTSGSSSSDCNIQSSSIEDRHASVLAKLRDSRAAAQEPKKGPGTKLIQGLFGKRK